MRRTASSLLLLLVLLVAGAAGAANIQTVTFEGTATLGASSNAALGGFFQEGVDRLRITFSYDTDATEVGSPGNCCSAFVNAVVGSQATVLRAGVPIYTAGWVGGNQSQMNLNQFGSADQVLFLAGQGNLSGAPVNGLPVAESTATLYYPGGYFPTADVLPPASSISLAQLNSGGFGLKFGPGAGTASIGATIDTITVVPEPGTMLLLALGLVGLVRSARAPR